MLAVHLFFLFFFLFLFQAFLIMFVITLIYCVLAVHLFKEKNPEFFGSLSAALLSLHQVVIGSLLTL